MKKRGLSAIVTTLIIILLVLVAVSGIWVVVSNFLDAGTETIELTEKCLKVDVNAVSVNSVENEAGNYSVTFNMKAGDQIDGIKINVFNATRNSGVIDFEDGNMTVLDTVTSKVNTDGVTSASKIEYTIYFLDPSGNEQLCPTTNSKDF